MKFVFVTLFPEQIEAAAGHSVLKRALDTGIIAMECVNPRDFSLDRHHSVDDAPFGGGVGMVLKPEPVVEAIKAAKAKESSEGQSAGRSCNRHESGRRYLPTVAGRNLGEK